MNEWTAFVTPQFALDSLVCVIGLALHLAMKWQEARELHTDDTGHSDLSFREYTQHRPAQTWVATLATVGSFVVAYAVNWMNPGMAFACGYMGSSIAENFAGKFAARVPK